MVDLSALGSPAVLFTAVCVVGVVVTLVLAVMQSLQAPAKKQQFNEALSYVMTSELDLDTALNRDEKRSRNWFEFWAELTEKTGKVVTDKSAPGRIAAGAAVFAALIGLLVFPGGVVGLLVAPVAVLAGYYFWLSYEAGKRVQAMEKQLPNLLSGMRANLQAGSTPQQSLLAVADDMPSPLGDEMRWLKKDLNVNVSLEVALGDLAERVPSREMQFLVASIEIAVRSGSDLDPQLETIEEIVKQRTRIRQKLRAAVAQVKPTQWIALGAVPAMFLVSLRTDANRAYWFGSGFWVLVLAAVIYSLGFAAIRWMIKGVENS